MPRSTRRPLDEHARSRLRNAQRLESDALAAVHSASMTKQSTQAKLDAVVAKHRNAIDRAEDALSKAQAHLVSVSGLERAALLLEQPVAALRAVLRTTRGSTRGEPD